MCVEPDPRMNKMVKPKNNFGNVTFNKNHLYRDPNKMEPDLQNE